VCELFGKVREKWPHLSEKYFKLSNGVTELSPDNPHAQLDDWSLGLRNNANIFVTFAAQGG